jgi:glycine hydroxymethyltransferase
MRGFSEDDVREVGSIIVDALAENASLGALRARVDALCEKRPLYPGFRGFPTYVS